MPPSVRSGLIAAAVATGLAGCAQPGPELGRSRAALEAFCEASVAGTVRDVETDYLPTVVNCENGAADFEALKVQAVAARTFLYYKLATAGSIGDGQGDQVYGCGKEAGDLHRQAVAETSGQILRYQGTTIAAFYVAGSLQDGPGCTGGTNDPTSTERFVTYNLGRSGDELEQTTLGYVNAGNLANRGCMGQNASDCLAEEGWLHADILPFFYGEDIELSQAEGPCVEALLEPPGGEDPGGDGDGGGVPDDEPPPGQGGDFVSTGCAAGGGSAWPGAALLGLAVAVRRRRRA